MEKQVPGFVNRISRACGVRRRQVGRCRGRTFRTSPASPALRQLFSGRSLRTTAPVCHISLSRIWRSSS
ncbi:MAG: hypothetical protein LUH46_06775, partial [Alistipes sp.]|nr:hypothetical protein [Alistipes sp.]